MFGKGFLTAEEEDEKPLLGYVGIGILAISFALGAFFVATCPASVGSAMRMQRGESETPLSTQCPKHCASRLLGTWRVARTALE